MFQQDFHAYPYQDNSPDDLGKVMYTAAELTTDINPDQRKGKCDTAITIVGVIIVMLRNANEIPTAKASILVANERPTNVRVSAGSMQQGSDSPFRGQPS